MYSIIHPRDVSEFSYRYGDELRAHVFISFSVENRELEVEKIMKELKEHDLEALDASHNEMAKAHGRYLVGGRKKVPFERLFRFTFPERPGSLFNFFTKVKNPKWNCIL